MTERFYYIDKWTDEVIPCAATLEAWAKWLAEANEDFPDAPAKIGERFSCSISECVGEIVCTRQESDGGFGDWEYDSPVPDAYDWVVARYGPGAGWDAEDIAASLRDLLSERDGFYDGEVIVGVMKDRDAITVELRRDDSGAPILVEVDPFPAERNADAD